MGHSAIVQYLTIKRNGLHAHHSADELNEVGPASFTDNPEWPNSSGENNWYELRLKGNATIWRDDYCLIPFGLLEPPVISVNN